ncbi:MAG: CHAP domain-containing protein [Pseudomonadota bacterium]
MPIDLKKFTTHLSNNADKLGFGKGKCALFVRLALQAGGLRTAVWPVHAREWGPTLLAAGFHEIEVARPETFTPMKGDVAIIQATSIRKSGHIQGYDGTNWVSDFVQRNGFWPGPEYRTEKPSYVVYRR